VNAVPLEPRVAEYLHALFGREDATLQTIRAQHGDGLPDILISAEEARLIAVLLRAVAARRVLEVGTLGGYSGVWIARAIGPDGRLVTIERDRSHAAAARDNFRRAGVAGRVTVEVGKASAVLARLSPPFDAVFLDADKAPLPEYYRHAMRLLRPGGLLLVDNALMDGRVADPDDRHEEVEGIRTVNRLAADDAALDAVVVPIRDGLLVGVRR
jgi:predicted O-methyltransferase YrrM